ncbi:unnamed protein product [Ectocarpus sp. 12 AP-2014]
MAAMAKTENEFASKLHAAQGSPFLRVLVTGGAGFLGSHLCRRLLDEGHQVICLDNFFTSQKLNIQDLFDRPNFEFVRHDITEPFRAEVDQIYNMACPASPVHYQYNPIKTTKVHVPVLCGLRYSRGLSPPDACS